MTWEKDCGCVAHRGPHWIHVDEMWRASNRKMLELGMKGNALALKGFLIEDLNRLRTKKREMESRGIESIPSWVVEQAIEDLAGAPEVYARIRTERKAQRERELTTALDRLAREHDQVEGDERKAIAELINGYQQELGSLRSET